MAGKGNTDAQKVLESIRLSQFADRVTADLLNAVYALEHEKQFEDERGTSEAALRSLITDAVEDKS